MILKAVGKVVALGLVLATMAALLPAQQDELGLLNAHRPEQDVLFSGQPTAEQLGQIVEAGYRVIDLRATAENRGFDETALLRELGADYTSIPVDAATLKLDQTFERFFEAFATERPVLVHCASGNRVGGLYFAYLVERQGFSRERALATARANGLRSDALEEAISAWLERRAGARK